MQFVAERRKAAAELCILTMFNCLFEVTMALQIANPGVVAKVERLAKATGLSKTALVERALDQLLLETQARAPAAGGLAALLAQLDRIPDRTDTPELLRWDSHGLPI
jgi:antitoxin VapB